MANAEPRPVGNLQALQRQHDQQIQPATYYAALDQLGLNYGPGFRNLQQILLGPQSALGRVRLNGDLPKLDSPMHPALLDACLHLFPASTGEYGDFSQIADLGTTTYLPITIEKFAIYRDVPTEVWSHCRARPDDQVAGERYCVDIDIYAEDGSPVATLMGLTIKMLSREAFLPAEADGVSQWLYGVDWVACEPLDEITQPKPGHWLIVSTDAADVDDLLSAMEASDQTFEMISPGHLLEPADVDGFHPSVSTAPLVGIINATALSARPLALLSPTDLSEATQVQFELSQALLKLATETLASAEVQPKIWILTQGAQAPLETHLGGEALQSVLWGHGRAIAQEHPNVWGGLIDIDDRTQGRQVLQELLAADNREDQVALRDGGRYGPRLQRRRFDAYHGPVQPEVNPERSYLITGGLGALGLKVAHWLVEEQGARHIWLVSRRNQDAQAQAAINLMQQMGAEIVIASANIADTAEVDQLIANISDHGPPLDGLFHCAGLLDDGIMIEMDWERYHRVTAAKVEGSWALHQATEHLQLGHFVLFSSILSVIGSMGQLNYVSGNAFLDGLVSYRRRLGLAATAMNWGPWENAGLAVESGERGEAIWRARGIKFIPIDIGLQAINAALVNQQEHLVVTHTDWDRFVGQFARPPMLYDQLTSGQTGAGRQLLDDLASTLEHYRAATAAAERNGILIAAITQICTVNLELDQSPDPDLSLREVGLDSLMSITVINDIENVFGVRLPARELLKGPSINELVRMIREELPDADGKVDVEEKEPQEPAAPHVAQSGSWLVIQKPRPNARMRLICFPFAGGGSAVFDNWGEAFDSDIEIISVEAPGRLGRIDEEPVRTIEQFARGLYPELSDMLDRPYAMLGHCLGGLTLYEMLRFFQAQRDPMPEHVFVSGARPPSVLRAPGSFEAELNDRLTSYDEYQAGRLGHHQPDDVFAEIVRAFGVSESSKMLEVEELRQLVLPTVRAEFEMTSRYIYLPERPFPVPITCFRGIHDDYVKQAHADLWEKFTTKRFEMFERDTGHFAIVEDFEFIRSIIKARLLYRDAESA